MASKAEFPLSLVIKAVDKATGPLAAITAKMAAVNAPFKKLSNSFSKLSAAARFPQIAEGFKNVGSAAGRVGSEAFALGAKIAALAAGAGIAFFSIVHGAIEAGDQLLTMSERVGLSVDVFASLSHAANKADIDQESFNGAMDQFNKRLGEAKAGGGSLLTFLKKVSPTLADQIKNAKGTEEAFGLMTDAMARIEDPGKRAALAAMAFGKSGLQMGNFLHQGSAEIQKQQLQFLALAGSQEKFAHGASDLDNAIKDVQLAFGGLSSAVMSELFPVLNDLAGQLKDFLAENRDGISKWAKETAAAISAWVKGGGIQRLIEGFKSFMATVQPIVDKLGGWPMVIAGIAAAILGGPLLMALAGFGAALVSLGITLAPIIVGFGLAGAAIGGLALVIIAAGASILSNWGEVKFFFKSMWEDLVFGARQAWEFLKPIFDKIAPFVGILASPLKFGAEMVGKAFGGGAERPSLSADAARGPTGPLQSEAAVTVNFTNAPPGTRVTPARDNTASLETIMSSGPLMSVP